MTHQTDETEGRIYSVIEVAVHPEAAFWEITTLRTQLAEVKCARDTMGNLWAQEKSRADRAEAALAAQPSPDVAALVEAAKDALTVLEEYHMGSASPVICDLVAAIARVKGGEA